MVLLVLRLGLTPLFVTLVTALERWCGRAVGGVLAGLPLTSAPLMLVLALDRGPGFAAASAGTAAWGAAVQAAVCWVYARALRSVPGGWAGLARCLALAVGCFALGAAGMAWVVITWRPPVLVALVVAVAVAVAVSWCWPRCTPHRPAGRGVARPLRTLTCRCLVAEGMTATVTAIAPVAGPRLAGFVGTLPVLALTLAAFTQREAGVETTQRTLRAVAAASPGVAAFLTVVALAVPRWPLPVAFAAAGVAVAVATAGTSRRAVTRP